MRATFSMEAIFATPRPSPATGTAQLPCSSTSAVGKACVPSLSFRRRSTRPFQAPSGRRNSSRNNDRPAAPGSASSVRASTMAISVEIADANHLVPYSRNDPSPCGTARVVNLADIGTASGFGHPLAGGKSVVACNQASPIAARQQRIMGFQQRRRRIRHRQRASGDGADRIEQIGQTCLQYPAKTAMAWFMGDRHQPLFLPDLHQPVERRIGVDTVHTMPHASKGKCRGGSRSPARRAVPILSHNLRRTCRTGLKLQQTAPPAKPAPAHTAAPDRTGTGSARRVHPEGTQP